jgi:glucuronoarabinoxylan endo-1,4-beta-xylanase
MLGLTILRVRISETEEFESDMINCKAALNVNPNVKCYGTPWTVPLSMMNVQEKHWDNVYKHDIHVGKLKPESYNDYAKHLQKFVDYFKSKNVPLYAVSTINEPDFHECREYSNTRFEPQELVNFIKTSAKLITGTKIMASESFGYKPDMNDAILVIFKKYLLYLLKQKIIINLRMTLKL